MDSQQVALSFNSSNPLPQQEESDDDDEERSDYSSSSGERERKRIKAEEKERKMCVTYYTWTEGQGYVIGVRVESELWSLHSSSVFVTSARVWVTPRVCVRMRVS